MDCYFRQTWLDSRLSFTGVIQTVTLGISTLDKIWKPDTYFLNGQQSYLHTVTVPNRFVRINQEGRVLYSQRYYQVSIKTIAYLMFLLYLIINKQKK